MNAQEVQEGIKQLQEARSQIDVILKPLQKERQENMVESQKLGNLLDAMQALCKHVHVTTEHLGNHDRDVHMTCVECGYTRY
jgi:hypothetical protein